MSTAQTSEVITKGARAETTERSLRQEVERFLDDAGGDIERAADALMEYAASHPKFMRAHADDLVRRALGDMMRESVRTTRATIWNSASYAPQTPEQQRRRFMAQARATSMTLMDFPLPGGKPLRDAMRDEVKTAAEFYETTARDHASKGRWLRLVAAAVPTDRTVGDVLTVERLGSLQQEAQAHG